MKLTSPSWWISMFMSTLMTMVFIYLIKMVVSKANVPILTDIAGAV